MVSLVVTVDGRLGTVPVSTGHPHRLTSDFYGSQSPTYPGVWNFNRR